MLDIIGAQPKDGGNKMLRCFLVHNGNKINTLLCQGVGMFSVFSGNKQYTNQPGCTDVPNHGAIPAGTYWIVDRPSGGLKSQTITFIKDIVTNVDHNSWFALYRDDGTVNDRTWINGIMRGQFRLHPIGPLGLSEGCVTFYSQNEFNRLRAALLKSKTAIVPGTTLQAYGAIEVKGYEKTCPVAR
ncbi:DUF2778 domain-containing protein [Serratia nevei]|uniref:DUF2778 domain-containing protein n=1 Tax=Serratia nevei TaxID=2703794 RepID=UPI0027E444EE|nr:DUF2778 domain-containing protein [Serratia nevei]MDQ7771700.1 DUF2778 domain-containing protein [Serratia nevei]